MEIKFIEAAQGSQGPNWGKFLVGRFTNEEWARRSTLPKDKSPTSLLWRVGWSRQHIVVMDLQTGEGAIFNPGGWAQMDLEKHAVWVCPLFEPFLQWLWGQDLSNLAALPSYVELPEAPFELRGYRRPGPQPG